MKSKLALISTGIGVVEPIMAIVRELSPETEMINIVDDCIVRSIAANDNIIPPWVFRRMSTYMILAEEAGADAALLTCSSISEAVDVSRPLVRIPIFKIDEPMADKAVSMGNRIGVAATLRTTLEPTKRLVLSRARKAGKTVSIEESLSQGAFEALQGGDASRHDEMVRKAVSDLLPKCDVIVMAQASMARAVQSLGQHQERILTSPRLGVAYVIDHLHRKR
jgi:hypothetical protein